jgi:hypothetical protein
VEGASVTAGVRLGAGATLCEAPSWWSACGVTDASTAAALWTRLPPGTPTLRAGVPEGGGGFSIMANTMRGSAWVCGASVLPGAVCGEVLRVRLAGVRVHSIGCTDRETAATCLCSAMGRLQRSSAVVPQWSGSLAMLRGAQAGRCPNGPRQTETRLF